MTHDVREAIRREIRERGPIAFDAFMELALYAPGGYYERPPVGPAGDFVTGPHVHWWLAYGLAMALGELHDALGPDRPVRLVELGAGDGTLARQLLEILAEAGPIEYTAVERSAGARRALADVGVRVAAALEDAGPFEEAVLFANELLDNLPFRRVRRRGDRLVEVRIALEDERLVETEVDADPGLAALCPRLQDGAEAPVPAGALDLLDRLAGRLRRSYALFVDYSTERGTATHGYLGQRVVTDLLERPGASDVTAGVDLDLFERRAREAGLVVQGRVTQRDALIALGFGDWVERERDRQASLVAANRRADAARAWSARSRATILVDPSGLGGHRWLLLATPGLSAPRWIEDATRQARSRRPG